MARTKKGGAAKSTSEFVDSATGAKIPADPALWRSDGGGTYLPVLPKFRKGDIDGGITDFSRAIAMDPNDGITYVNRAWAYCRKQEYDLAWADVHRAEELGTPAPDVFLRELREASGRED